MGGAANPEYGCFSVFEEALGYLPEFNDEWMISPKPFSTAYSY
jgi:hypothetical protein